MIQLILLKCIKVKEEECLQVVFLNFFVKVPIGVPYQDRLVYIVMPLLLVSSVLPND